jgi:uncharacterized protein (DUF1330 family)
VRIDLYPRPEQVQALLASDIQGPVVMVNLLKFKRVAGPPDEGLSGEEAYRRYGEQMAPFVTRHGGRLIFSGRAHTMVLGQSDVEFEMIALMEYPSKEAFAKITTEPEVAEFAKHRAAGLEGQWLIASTEMAIRS